jgi:ABC-type phosphate transport system substrate-binding protein
LDTGKAQPPSGRSRAGKRATAVTAAAAIVLTAAQAYPIINYEYAVVNASQPSATRAQDLRAFLTWAVTSGTAQLAKVHFQPLPPSVITLSDAQIARIRGRAG